MRALCGCRLSVCVGVSYTALVHTIARYFDLDSQVVEENVERLAVGLTDGVAPSDLHPVWQTWRQEHCPLSITEKGISFDCLQA